MANIPGNDPDNRLQEWMDSNPGNNADAGFDQADLDAYKLLYQILEQQPPVELSASFAANVAVELERRHQKKLALRYSFIFPVAILLIVVIYYIASIYTKSIQSDHVVSLVWKFKWHISFGICCFIIIQFFDQLLVKRKHLDFI